MAGVKPPVRNSRPAKWRNLSTSHIALPVRSKECVRALSFLRLTAQHPVFSFCEPCFPVSPLFVRFSGSLFTPVPCFPFLFHMSWLHVRLSWLFLPRTVQLWPNPWTPPETRVGPLEEFALLMSLPLELNRGFVGIRRGHVISLVVSRDPRTSSCRKLLLVKRLVLLQSGWTTRRGYVTLCYDCKTALRL